MHATVRQLQPHVAKVYGVVLGYKFAQKNLFGPWDNTLQEDLEVLDAAGMVDNHDELRKRVATHRLAPTAMGLRTAEILGRDSNYLFGVTRKRILDDLKARMKSRIKA